MGLKSKTSYIFNILANFKGCLLLENSMLGHAMFSIFPELQDVNVIRVLLAAFQTELHPNLLLLQY